MRPILAATLAVTLPLSVEAASLDLTQEISDFDANVTGFRLVEDGVTFSFFDAVRPGSPSSFLNTAGTTPGTVELDGLAGPGLQFGGGGFSARAFSMSVSQNISLSGYTVDQRLGSGVTLDVVAFPSLTTLSSGNGASVDGSFSFASGPITLAAGETYVFDFFNTGAAKQSALEALEFTAAAPIPLPAGLPMMLGAVGVFAWMRKRAA